MLSAGPGTGSGWPPATLRMESPCLSSEYHTPDSHNSSGMGVPDATRRTISGADSCAMASALLAV